MPKPAPEHVTEDDEGEPQRTGHLNTVPFRTHSASREVKLFASEQGPATLDPIIFCYVDASVPASAVALVPKLVRTVLRSHSPHSSEKS